MKEVLLSARDVTKRFAGQTPQELVLDHVNMEVFAGDFTVIMGASGAGKSTLLYGLSGMDDITQGSVRYKGREITGMNEKQMSALRAREFGFVFQQTHLVSNLTLYENVTVAGYLAKCGDVERKARALLTRMHVEHARDRLPAQVSGGEAQRAAIARAMIGTPGLLFADEPTGALNRRNTEEVLDLLTTLNGAGQSILMVTHDPQAAARGNRLLYLEDGKLLDELCLSPYDAQQGRGRESEVNKWLASMAW